jgi:hypothetical protein
VRKKFPEKFATTEKHIFLEEAAKTAKQDVHCKCNEMVVGWQKLPAFLGREPAKDQGEQVVGINSRALSSDKSASGAV